MQLTAGELIKQLEKVDSNSIVRFQWIEDNLRKNLALFWGEM